MSPEVDFPSFSEGVEEVAAVLLSKSDHGSKPPTGVPKKVRRAGVMPSTCTAVTEEEVTPVPPLRSLCLEARITFQTLSGEFKCCSLFSRWSLIIFSLADIRVRSQPMLYCSRMPPTSTPPTLPTSRRLLHGSSSWSLPVANCILYV